MKTEILSTTLSMFVFVILHVCFHFFCSHFVYSLHIVVQLLICHKSCVSTPSLCSLSIKYPSIPPSPLSIPSLSFTLLLSLLTLFHSLTLLFSTHSLCSHFYLSWYTLYYTVPVCCVLSGPPWCRVPDHVDRVEYYGDISADSDPDHYMTCVRRLIREYQSRPHPQPLIVNTMGWRQGQSVRLHYRYTTHTYIIIIYKSASKHSDGIVLQLTVIVRQLKLQ